eukprot:Gregarina_sp_Poly_1__2578@NODE_16_length_22882_cov_82_653956_g14_i0_p7_GENE_NODE_16_length_22882_cov_82_653956_g14_i0NODE_16_length_22882_cov_82_653956_g14_i0_p7_ORF_typecomplete_len365_score36_27Galactosyl_T/PF01762_21/7_6e21_NODE_16_length_22882_cov_82_653956_g14_i01688717981
MHGRVTLGANIASLCCLAVQGIFLWSGVSASLSDGFSARSFPSSPPWVGTPLGDAIMPRIVEWPNGVPNNNLLVAIFTVEKFERDYFRYWIPRLTNRTVSLVFPKGRKPEVDSIAPNVTSDISLSQEAALNKDLIIGNFHEEWRTLSGNFFIMVKYFLQGSRSPLLVKTDADVIQNWRAILPGLRHMTTGSQKNVDHEDVHFEKDPWWAGAVFRGTEVIRDPESKYGESIDLDVYPDYVSGVFYTMNRKTAALLFESRRQNRVKMRNDDALAGILLEPHKVVPVDLPRVITGASRYLIEPACGSGIVSIWDCPCDKWWAFHPAGMKPVDCLAERAAQACAQCPHCGFPNEAERLQLHEWERNSL